jgi:hypothetical protein
MLMEIFLSHILLNPKTNIFVDIPRIFYDLGNLDRNMWFVIFITFWYCISYCSFRFNLSDKEKLIFLCSVSIIFLSVPHFSSLWKANAFSFPIGFWVGINFQYIVKKIETLISKKIVVFISLILSCLMLRKILGYISKHNITTAIASLVILIAIVGLICILKRKGKFYIDIEKVSLFSAVLIVYLNICGGLPEYSINNIFESIFENCYSVLLAIPILLAVSLMVKLNIYSYFLSFIGEISFELYLIHGMFMYSFDFILFRGNIALTFFIYFTSICIVSLGFRKLNSISYESLLNNLSKE